MNMPHAMLFLSALICANKPMTVEIDHRRSAIVSLKALSLRGAYGGAMDISMVRRGPNLAKRLLMPDVWRGLLRDSVPAISRFNVESIRAEILLQDGHQILIDDGGRLVMLAKPVNALRKFNGPVRELRASQMLDVLIEVPDPTAYVK